MLFARRPLAALVAMTLCLIGAPASAQCPPVDVSSDARPWNLPGPHQDPALVVSIRDAAWLAAHPAFGEPLAALLAEHGLSARHFGEIHAGVGQGATPSITLAFEANSDVELAALTALLHARGLALWSSSAYQAPPSTSLDDTAHRGAERQESEAGSVRCVVTYQYSTAEATTLPLRATELPAPVVVTLRMLDEWAALEPALRQVSELRVLIGESIRVELALSDPSVAGTIQLELANVLMRISAMPEVDALGLGSLLASAEVVALDTSVVMTLPEDEELWEPAYVLLRDILESEFQ